ncbi:MAG: tetratricopeptide repeat protein [Candidatus Aminicenantes bacterium]|nr:tetratricopeptide repeat protein [Candidatus Aminicenantes bacterium]
MKKPWIIKNVTIMFISMIIIINSSPLHSQPFATASGTVKSEDGKPIKGAKVILIFSEDGTKYELTTDKKGRWRKASMRSGTWTVGFMAEGYEPQNFNVTLSAIKRNPPIDIKLTPVPKSPLIKGDALYQQKKYEEALREYQKVLAENQDLYQLHDKIGLCYYRLNDLENAIEAFKLMLEKEPQSQDTLINLSAIYFEKGDLEEGMKYFRQLDEKSLEDPSIFYNIGVLLFKNLQIDTAIDYLQKCLALDPTYVDGYYQLALVNLNKGDLEEAKKNLRKVIELAPESEKAALAKKMLENIT